VKEVAVRWTPPVDLNAAENKLCQKLRRVGRLYAFLRKVRSRLFDDDFQTRLIGMYSGAHTGTEPAVPAQVAMLLLLQGYARVSDDEAIRRAQMDDAWKMVLGTLGEEDSPVSKGTLQNMRQRMIATDMDQVLLARTVELARTTKLFGAKALKGLRLAIDSAPLEGAGRVEDTINLIGHALRDVVRAIAAAQDREDIAAVAREAGAQVAVATSTKASLDLDWDAEDATQHALDALLAQVAAVRTYLITQPDGVRYAGTVRDALDLLDRLLAQDTEPLPSAAPPSVHAPPSPAPASTPPPSTPPPSTPPPSTPPPSTPPPSTPPPSASSASSLPSRAPTSAPVGTPPSPPAASSSPPRSGLRIAQRVAPDRIISINDPEMRHGRKNKTVRIDGFKRYIARDLDEGALILAVAVKAANVPEHHGADTMRAELAAYGPVAAAHIDRAFLASQLVHEVDDTGGEVVARPYSERAPHGYSKRSFAIDLDQRTVTCPAGKVARISGPLVHFGQRDCGPCPQRTQCQKPGAKQPRIVNIHEREALLQKLVQRAATPKGRAGLRPRTAVEHALAHVVFRQGDRARYFGTRKNEYDLRRSSAIVNLQAIDRAERLAAAA
jgi:Transposase DDE domain/Transposase domain (DUF772)